MAMQINTNVFSENAQRNLSKTLAPMQKSMERLSSGLRINTAADDAAGLAITTRMTSLINGYTVAERNANDGISLVQTAEGAMSEISGMLQRIRDLALQSSNDTLSVSNRADLQKEVTELVGEITRVGTTVTFNGQKLLDGSFSGKKFQVGAEANETISVSIEDLRASALGASALTTSTADVDANAIASGDVIINGTTIAASVATDDTKSFASNSASAIAKAAAINKSAGTTGVIATVVATDKVAPGAVAAGSLVAGDLVINGVDIGAVAGVLVNDSDNKLINAINAKASSTGVTAALNAGVVTLTAADGRNITTSGTAGGAAIHLFAAAAATDLGRIQLSSTQSFTVSGANAAARTGVAVATYNVDYTNVVSNISLTTTTGAQSAIQVLDTALQQIVTKRAQIGAYQNRLTSTIATLQVGRENNMAARSRIQDADFAIETAILTRSQVLQQAGTAMLAQANMAPQGALSLLRG